MIETNSSGISLDGDDEEDPGKEVERASRPASDAKITNHYLSADAVRSYWHRNFMLDVKKPSLVAYEDTLKGRKTGNKKRDRLPR